MDKAIKKFLAYLDKLEEGINKTRIYAKAKLDAVKRKIGFYE